MGSPSSNPGGEFQGLRRSSLALLQSLPLPLLVMAVMGLGPVLLDSNLAHVDVM